MEPTLSDRRAAALDPISLSAPLFQGNEWKYVKECLDTGWVSSAGSFVGRFERELAAYVGAPYAVAVLNGTAGLHVALRIIGVEPEDEVIVPTLTFVASVNPIRYCRAHPIFMDASPTSWQMDGDKVEHYLERECEVRDDACYNRRTGRRVRAILPVHILGLACEIDRITQLARHYRLRVVEDATEAMGVRYRGRHAGTFGDVGVFSFNGNKIITTGGGGMIVTADPRLANYARYLTTQAKDDPVEYFHSEIGYNYRLTNLQAAVGVAQLEQLDGFITKKRAIARAYRHTLAEIPGLTLMPRTPHTEPTYWLYTVLLPPGTTLDDRKAVLARLRETGIEARGLWRPVHTLPPYLDSQAHDITHAPGIYERALSLPSSALLRPDDVGWCVAALRKALAGC
jgi:perosamine synthetase